MPWYNKLESVIQPDEKTTANHQDLSMSEGTDEHPGFDIESSTLNRRDGSNNKPYKLSTYTLATALVILALFHARLWLNQHANSQCVPVTTAAALASYPSQHTIQVKDCGSSVAEARAKNCTWDELSKAYLPRECPRHGLEQYKTEGILHSPYANATSWPLWADQAGAVQLNFNQIAADEEREPSTTLWSTSRQHLSHCAWLLKRTLWSYENGYGHYMKVSRLHHVNHCVNMMWKGAIAADSDVDAITTTTRVHFGSCRYEKAYEGDDSDS